MDTTDMATDTDMDTDTVTDTDTAGDTVATTVDTAATTVDTGARRPCTVFLNNGCRLWFHWDKVNYTCFSANA